MGNEISRDENFMDFLAFMYHRRGDEGILSRFSICDNALFWKYFGVMSRMLILVHAMPFDGFIVWNYWLVFLSFLISWLTCQVVSLLFIIEVIDCGHFQYQHPSHCSLIIVP